MFKNNLKQHLFKFLLEIQKLRWTLNTLRINLAWYKISLDRKFSRDINLLRHSIILRIYYWWAILNPWSTFFISLLISLVDFFHLTNFCLYSNSFFNLLYQGLNSKFKHFVMFIYFSWKHCRMVAFIISFAEVAFKIFRGFLVCGAIHISWFFWVALSILVRWFIATSKFSL